MKHSFDMSKLRQGVKRVASQTNFTKRELMNQAGKGFIKDIVKITPPGSKGASGGAARKQGEATVDVDTALTLEPKSETELSQQQQFFGGDSYAANQLKTKTGKVYLEDRNHILWTVAAALAFHQKKRNKGSGRPPYARKSAKGSRMRMRDAGAHNAHVGRWKADDIALVPRKVFEDVRKALKQKVGWLAAGWNKAAEHLGVKLPTWVRRHGTNYGEVKVTVTATTFRLELGNVVDFVGNVSGYARRIQKALDYQANKLNRRADFLMKEAIRKAGFK